MRELIKQQIKNMGDKLYEVSLDKDYMWELYLDSHPEVINGIYKKRRIHDCSACRQFVKTMGNVVAIKDNKLVTIWDIECEDPEYQQVADAMAKFVRSSHISNIFRHPVTRVGIEKNVVEDHEVTFAGTVVKKGVKVFEHLHTTLPPSVVIPKDSIDTLKSEVKGIYDVFLRGLREITLDSVATTLELIAQGSIYRGAEHEIMLKDFYALLVEVKRKRSMSLFAWENYQRHGARIRNTAIGTLLQNLSAGMDVDEAVGKFEKIVAPENYKRPKSLVTPAMVARAKEKIEELGYTSALARRYANSGDLTINNVLFRGEGFTKAKESTDVFDEIQTLTTPKNFSKVEEISVTEFLGKVMPGADKIEVYFESRHKNRLVSLIAPEDPEAKNMFKWPNKFSWSYTGDLADSNIKEKVKLAGGDVTGEFCNRLAWGNYDDLDLHLVLPSGGEISFLNKHDRISGGKLDVDMNAGSGTTREPVENIVFPKISMMRDGIYGLFVRQFRQRESTNVGFDVEIQILDKVYNFNYPKPVVGDVPVAKLKKLGDELTLVTNLPSFSKTETVWNISTNNFYPVTAIMQSPNFWQVPGVGNPHLFFMLQGCLNDGTARGFYNEFLSNELNEHRKVLEIVGAKVRASESMDQLSGIGFSTTQPGELVVRVTGKTKRILKVKF